MIYFIQMGHDGPIKIGQSDDPFGRLKDLQVGAPYKLHLVAVTKCVPNSEGDIHARFANIRLNGEWFKPDQALLDFIAMLRVGDMRSGVFTKGGQEHCRICGLGLSPDKEASEMEHIKAHRAMSHGKAPVSILNVLESCSLMLLYETPNRLAKKHKPDLLKRAVAFSLWEKARRKKIPCVSFEAFMLDHLNLIDAVIAGDELAETRARDRVVMCWSSYK